MNRIHYIPIFLCFLFSCSKEQNTSKSELNISYSNISAVSSITQELHLSVYPNPFQNKLSVKCNNTESAQLLISNENGDSKKIDFENNISIEMNFISEEPGVYYIEALVGKKILRTYVLKY